MINAASALILFLWRFAFFVFAGLESLQTLFAALGALCRTFHQLGTDQFDHGLLRAIALAISQAHYARIAAVALAETCPQLVEQLLHRFRCFDVRRRLTTRMQRVMFRERDH